MAYFDPVQDVVANALQSMPFASEQNTASIAALMPQAGAARATSPGMFNLFAGQGAGGFGQGSVGTEGSQPNRKTTSVFG